MYTTLSSITRIAQEGSVTNPYASNYVPMPFMEITGGVYDPDWQPAGTSYYTCDHPIRNPVAQVSCVTTLEHSTAYAAFFALWVVYFSLLALYHLCIYLSVYDVNDLRFYLLILKTITHPYNRYYVIFGLVFTAVTVAVSLARMVSNPNANRPVNLVDIIFSGLVNVLLLRPFMSGPALNVSQLEIAKEFPVAIRLPADVFPPRQEQSIFNAYGAFVRVDRVISLLFQLRVIDMQYPHRNVFRGGSQGSSSNINHEQRLKEAAGLLSLYHPSFRRGCCEEESDDQKGLLPASASAVAAVVEGQ